jgi:hypothetical protein
MSLWRCGIWDRPAKGIDLVAQLLVLARERIDDGNGCRNDEARRVTDRGCRASHCLEDFFATGCFFATKCMVFPRATTGV